MAQTKLAQSILAGPPKRFRFPSALVIELCDRR